MDAADLVLPVEIGERAGNLQDAVITAGGEFQFLRRIPQKLHAGGIGAAKSSMSAVEQRALVEISGRPASAKRRICRSRAIATRAATVALDSAGRGRMRSAAETAGTSMRISMRSISGPEMRPWYSLMQRGPRAQV